MTTITETTCFRSLGQVMQAIVGPAVCDYPSLSLAQLSALACIAHALEAGNSDDSLDTVESAFLAYDADYSFSYIEDLIEVVGELVEIGLIDITKLPGNPNSEFAYRKLEGIKIELDNEAHMLLNTIASKLHSVLPVLDKPAQRESLRICAED